jgi:NADP-dependent 3-hydroxy acid dehydrogenase YdfG
MKQTLLITGATARSGQTSAELFAARDWRLAVCGPREERLREPQSGLEAVISTCRLHVREHRKR